MKKIILLIAVFIISMNIHAQTKVKTRLRLPDTGQTSSYTDTFGEDSDYNLNSPYLILNSNGTVTDTITGLMWQQTDGGEMTVEKAFIYCDTLTLAGYSDWRLPNTKEAFTILNHQKSNPALDTKFFPKTGAEYWWTGDHQINDSSKTWATNAGGGIGNHPNKETISAGGTKKFHVRAVRSINNPLSVSERFTDNGNGTISDNLTDLIWEKNPSNTICSWEDALKNAENLNLAGYSDWRLPNIKELQSLNDESLVNPSLNSNYFSPKTANKYWSSTTLPNQITKAWYLDTQYGITTFDIKTNSNLVICVRSKTSAPTVISENFKVENYILATPNPAQNNLSVKNNGNTSINKISLRNAWGTPVFEKDQLDAQENLNINTSNLENGIYFFQFYQGYLFQTNKIIISK